MNRRTLPLLIILASLFAPISHTIAQTFSGHRWYLGNSGRTIQFNRFDNSSSVFNTNAAPLGQGGAAVAADPASGTVYFYTNGSVIYDVTNTPMPNGAIPNGNPGGNQSAAVAQVPDTPGQYFVITSSPTGTIQMTVVNMTLQGNVAPRPLGDVDESVFANATPVPGLTGQSPTVMTVPHSNGTDFWLITHDQGATTYNVTLFDQTGPVSTTTYANVGFIESAANLVFNPSNDSANPTLHQIGVAPAEAHRDVEILEFNNETGDLAFVTTVPNSSASAMTDNAVYDMEWSNNGKYLYVSIAGEAGATADLLQFDLTNPSATAQSVLPQPSGIDRSYGLQMGPDSVIYHLYEDNGQLFMGKISDPDTIAAQVDYVALAFPGNFGARQFPSFLPASDFDFNLDFDVVGTCSNYPTTFYPTVTPPADSLVWTINGERLSNGWSPVHTFESGGAYTVEVTAWLNGQSSTYSEVVNITQFDLQITLVQDTTACSEELPEPRKPGAIGCESGSGSPCFTLTAQVEGGSGATARWFGPEGELPTTGLTLAPRTAGFYYVIVESNGCQAYASVNIREFDTEDRRANIWYFGNGAGVDFNPVFNEPPDAPQPTPAHAMTAPEGTATISDDNGQVIFYTDGVSVWDRNNTQVATNIGGSQSATQSSLIMEVPGDPTLYYIFTTQEVTDGTYELRYTLFDLKLNGGTGGIVDPDGDPATPASTVLFTQSTERITNNGNWLIAHEYGNNNFRAYEITPEGISSPVFSSIGSDHTIASQNAAEGYMVVGTGGRLAVALPPGTIEIFNFVDSSGAVVNYRTPISVPGGGEVYGVQFSTNGERLFVTKKSHPNEIFEYEYDEDTDTYDFLGVISMTGQPGAMQIGPDGQLYVAVTGANALGAISVNNNPGELSTFNASAIPNLNGTVTLGLPNFTQTLGNAPQTEFLDVSGVCIGSPTQFSAAGKDSNIDKFDWTFDNEPTIVDGDPQMERTFTTPGTHTVRVRIYNKCGYEKIFEETFEVFDVPADPIFASGNNVICTGGSVRLYGTPTATNTDNSGNTYLWEPTGETSHYIDVTTNGVYVVTVTSPQGCTKRLGQPISMPFGNLDLGPDENICQNAPRTLSVNIAAPGIQYTWRVNGVVTPTTVPNEITVNTTTPGVFTYEVTITDGTCTSVDQKVFTVQPAPTFTLSGDDAACGVSDGGVEITINTPATPTSYLIQGISINTTVRNLTPGTYTESGLAAGVYTVTVTDQVTGCAAADIVNVDNNDFQVTQVVRASNCFPMALDVTVSRAGDWSYQVIGVNGVVDAGTANGANFQTNAVITTPGNYSVQVTETGVATPCTASGTITNVTQDAAVPVTIDLSNICASSNQVQAIATGATSFSWSSSPIGAIGSGANSNPVTINPGTWTLTVVASGAPGFCPGTATRTVTVSDPVIASFQETTPCAPSVTLTATPTGPDYIYRWQRDNGAIIPGSDQFSVTAESQITLRVINSLNGCNDTFAKLVKVVPPYGVAVALNSPVPCEGQPFQLDAIPERPVSLYQWSYNGSIIQGQTSSSLSDTRGGTYEVIAFEDICPSTPASIDITPAPVPSVNLTPLARICPEPDAPADIRTVTIAPSSVTDATAPFNWYRMDNGVPDFIVSDDNYVVTQPGIYRVEVTSANFCTAYDEIEVIAECDPIITGPNAFRPSSSNGKNQNFSLMLRYIADEDFQILIFNRWGELVFESTDPSFSWTGAYKNSGPLLPAGTYAYLLRYRSEYRPEDGIKEQRGGVVLLR